MVDYSNIGNQYYDTSQIGSDSASLAKIAADTSAFILSRINDNLIRELDYQGGYTDEEILDSMIFGNLKW